MDKKLLLWKCLPDSLPGRTAATAEILQAAIMSDLADEQFVWRQENWMVRATEIILPVVGGGTPALAVCCRPVVLIYFTLPAQCTLSVTPGSAVAGRHFLRSGQAGRLLPVQPRLPRRNHRPRVAQGKRCVLQGVGCRLERMGRCVLLNPCPVCRPPAVQAAMLREMVATMFYISKRAMKKKDHAMPRRRRNAVVSSCTRTFFFELVEGRNGRFVASFTNNVCLPTFIRCHGRRVAGELRGVDGVCL